jgi:hypothetical protein
LEDAGKFEHRLSGINQNQRDWTERAFTVGLGGPGKIRFAYCLYSLDQLVDI